MSAKRFSASGVMIVLLALSLAAAGCATTGSQNAQYKPHKPQMITAHGPELVGDRDDNLWYVLGHGFKLSDTSASALTALGRLTGLPGATYGYSWKP